MQSTLHTLHRLDPIDLRRDAGSQVDFLLSMVYAHWKGTLSYEVCSFLSNNNSLW